jgi:hypothetical protein
MIRLLLTHIANLDYALSYERLGPDYRRRGFYRIAPS